MPDVLDRLGLALGTIANGKNLGKQISHKVPGRAQLVCFTGKRGMGKTTGILAYIETREPRILVLDPHDDFEAVQLCDTLQQALIEMAEAGEGPCRRRVVPTFDSATAYDYGEEFFGSCFDGLRDCLVVCNEIALWAKPTGSGALTRFITQGRRLGLRMACDAQRLALVPYIVQSECTELVIFRVTRPRDLKAIAEWANDEIAQLSATLDVGQCLVVDL